MNTALTVILWLVAVLLGAALVTFGIALWMAVKAWMESR